MTKKNNIQPTALTNVRTNSLRARIGLALAGSGVAGALLVGGLFGFHGSPAATQTHAAQSRTAYTSNATLSARSSEMTTAPMSYSINNSYVDVARQAAINAGINPQYFINQIRQESGFNPNAGSPAGAQGIAQFMPGTAASMGINPYNPGQALNGAARLMARLSAQYGGNYAKALAAYNAGEGAVNSAVRRGGGNWLAFTPAETQHYVAIIMR